MAFEYTTAFELNSLLESMAFEYTTAFEMNSSSNKKMFGED